jgi:plastocyanin
MMVAQRRLRIGLLMVVLAAAGGITATIAQGDDPPATAAFRTVDGANVFERTAGSGTGTSASILTGGTVTFSNMSVEMHSVHFNAPAQGGVTCQQTSGGMSASATRFPFAPQSGSWGGVCTFTQAGAYSFFCDVHDGMTGTVVVSNAGGAPPVTTTTTAPTTTVPPVVTTPPVGTTTPTTPTGTTPTGTTPTTTTPLTPSSSQTPSAVARAVSVKVALTQRGLRVRGTIGGAKAAARAKVALLARRAALGLAGKASAKVGVGRLSARTTKAGTLTFAVALNGKARAALAKRGRLPLVVQVTAPLSTGVSSVKTFSIVLRPVG